jgi:Metallo-beta-lactamase superfamily
VSQFDCGEGEATGRYLASYFLDFGRCGGCPHFFSWKSGADPCYVPAGPVEARNQTELHRIGRVREDNRNCRHDLRTSL